MDDKIAVCQLAAVSVSVLQRTQLFVSFIHVFH
jgi:hypothetical protein